MTAFVPPYSPSLPDWQRQVSTAVSQITAEIGQRAIATDYGALGDGVSDDTAAIASALATGKPVHLPMTPAGQYNANISLTGGMVLTSEDDVVIHSPNTTAALTLSGMKNFVKVGEVNAPSAPYAVRYFNLQYSTIEIRRPGACTTACIYHDASAQTGDEGVNRWSGDDIQAGSVSYGIKIDSHATHTVEGETFDFNVILSATTCAIRVGTAGNNTVRWNQYNIGIDAQGITPMMIDIYNDANNFNLKNWAATHPAAVADIRFNSGTLSNYLVAAPGIQGQPVVVDLGTNTYDIAGVNGERIIGGIRGASGSSATGVDPFWAENRDSTNVTTKNVRMRLRGRDTTNAGKDVGAIGSTPQDGDWVNGTLTLYARLADALVAVGFIGINGTPNGVITAPVGSIATRRDGGAATTFYVKESGTSNTGWVAK